MHLHCTYCIDSHYLILKFKKFDVHGWRKGNVMVQRPTFYCCRRIFAPRSPQLPCACACWLHREKKDLVGWMVDILVVIAEWVQGDSKKLGF
jgi:hypothetical protein